MRMIEETKNTRRTFWAGAAVIFLIVLAPLVWHPSNKQVPEELVGEWHTTDPNYSGRSFEIGLVSISFATGEGTVSTGFIKEIREVSEGGRALYTISYVADGMPNEVSFYYDGANGEVIRFKNQEKTVWTKDKNS
jgi:hypothetical protein